MHFRIAQQTDLADIIKMLADDPLGSQREEFSDPVKPCYLEAFNHIDADPNNEIIVAADHDNRLLGFLQITYIPNLTLQGSWRAQLEGVRVNTSKRSTGIGKALVEHAIERAKIRGCHMVQLTSNSMRQDALRFYQSLGFNPSHVGFKLSI
ncbi:GNAT family N-acetyltransferase [Zwartia sp.]|uniref:GNAT family N-acetyltransferase n=1 Tax=Zwartia sp. TaxID=2978004 RepID=UPI0027204807|nr:GNAT family N-acetyltransferase [Zwartia sp.]MDO9024296.1 GNAT family N-acetyltransferase [Zwartia sp.]